MCGFAYIQVRKYKRKHRLWIRYVFKKRGTSRTYLNLVEKLDDKPGKWCRMEHSSTVESGCGFNFQSHKKWRNSIVFVNV